MDIDATLVSLVLTVGAPVLVGLYYLEGLLIGKLLHPSILLILYIVVIEPNILVMMIVASICIISATAGQWALYRGFNDEIDEQGKIMQFVPYLDRVPSIVKRRIGDQRMDFVDRQFDRYGGKAICVSNATPGLRGLMTVVAGLNNYPRRQFLLLSAIGNSIYMVILLAVANGLLEAVRFLPELDRIL